MTQTISAVILAGGNSVRMGQDKTQLQLGEKSLLERSVSTLGTQTKQLYISSGNALAFTFENIPVIADQHSPPRGPLEGILATLSIIAKAQPKTQWLLSSPVDCPFIPLDLVKKLLEEATRFESEACVAEYQGRKHHLCTLWSTSVLHKLAKHLEGTRYSVASFLDTLKTSSHNFDDATYDPFFNINTPEDLQEAKRLLTINR